MTYHQAKKKVLLKKSCGIVIFFAASLVLLIALLKGLYFHFEGVQILSAIDKIAKNFVYFLYSNTRFLNLLWEHVPTPSMHNPSSIASVVLVVSYMLVFIGAALFKSGAKLAARIKKIEQEIENELIRQSVSIGSVRTRIEIEQSITVKPSSIFNQVHELYIAPIVVGLILALVGYGLT